MYILLVKVSLLHTAGRDWHVEMREAFEAMMTSISAATAFLLAEGDTGDQKLLQAAKKIVLNQTYAKLIVGIKSDLLRTKEGVMTQLTLYLLDLQIGDSDLKDFSNIFSTFSREIKMHLVRFQPGSRQWILDDIRAWSARPNEPLFWVCATAGIGKSALSAQVWDYLNRGDRFLVLVFCKFGDSKRSDCTQVVLALAFQIATNASLPKQARELVKRGMAEIDKKSSPTIRDYWNCLILGPLKTLASFIPVDSSPFVLMLDALDELEKVKQVKLVSAVKSSAEDLPGFTKIFLTSRDEVQLKGVLGSGDSITRELIVESDPRNISDLTLYINKILLDDQLLSVEATEAVVEQQWRQDLSYEEGLADWEFYRLFSDFYVTEYQGHCLFASELLKCVDTTVVPWKMPEVTSNGYLYHHLPVHLYYARHPESLMDLLFNLDWLQKALYVRGVNDFCNDLLRYRSYLSDPELKLLGTTVKLSMPALRVSQSSSDINSCLAYYNLYDYKSLENSRLSGTSALCSFAPEGRRCSGAYLHQSRCGRARTSTGLQFHDCARSW